MKHEFLLCSRMVLGLLMIFSASDEFTGNLEIFIEKKCNPVILQGYAVSQPSFTGG